MFITKVYLAGKHTWEPNALNLREDDPNNVERWRTITETVPPPFEQDRRRGQDYKFVTRIEILDGGNGAEGAPTAAQCA